MRQPTLIEESAIDESARATDLKTRDQQMGDIERAAPGRVATAVGEFTSQPADAIDPKAFWSLRDLRACTGIVLAFQLIYLAADWSWTGAKHEAILPLHLFNILNAAIFLRLTHIRAYRERMPQFILGGWTLIFATTA